MSQRRILVVLSLCLLLPLLEGQYRTRRTVSAGSSPAALKGLVVTFRGVLKNLTKKEMLIQSDENQLLTMRYSRKTKFRDQDGEIKSSDVDLESRVSIDASEDVDLKLLAINVRVERTPKKALGK